MGTAMARRHPILIESFCRSRRQALRLDDIAKMMLRIRIRLRVDRVVIAGVGMLDDGHGIAQQRGVESLQPVDTRIAAKPSHLFACQTLRLLRDAHERVI